MILSASYLTPNKFKNLKHMKSSCLSICTSFYYFLNFFIVFFVVGFYYYSVIVLFYIP